MPLTLVEIKPSTRKYKKLVAVFSHGDDKKKELVHFGDKRYEDYLSHKSKVSRERYRARAKKGATAAPNTPAALSYHILWGDSTSLRRNTANFIKKYGLSR
jgi:hypothetical protein